MKCGHEKFLRLITLRFWGCEAFVWHETQDKLESIYERCRFVGFPQKSFEYLFYRASENVVFVVRRSVFLERELISQEVSRSQIDLNELQESSENEPLRKSSRVSQRPEFFGFHINVDGDTLINDRTLVNLDESSNYKEAMSGPEATQCKEAIDKEIQSMIDNRFEIWLIQHLVLR